MPAFSAAIGSFQAKLATTYFVMVLVTVRVLPFVLTVVLIRSVSLFVSTFGVRSYSDQRYSSMQMSTTRHSSRVSTGRAAGCGSSSAGRSGLNRDTSRPRVSDGGAGRESGKGALTMGASAAERPPEPASCGAGSTVTVSVARMAADARASLDDVDSAPASAPGVVAARGAPPFQIDVAALSMPDHSRPPSPAAHQAATATVPHNSTSANRGLTTRPPPPVRLP